jgi:hypothetical protein
VLIEEPEDDGALVLPGQRPWFPADEWEAHSFIFDHDSEVWLSMMMAKSPGTGALSRLMAAIWAQGKRVVVPCPFARMGAILRAKGFALEKGHPCDVWVKPAALAAGETR